MAGSQLCGYKPDRQARTIRRRDRARDNIRGRWHRKKDQQTEGHPSGRQLFCEATSPFLKLDNHDSFR
jgi:hypothetical protein